MECFLLDLCVSFVIIKEITGLWDSRPSIFWSFWQVDWLSLVGDLEIGGTALEPPAEGPPLLALSRVLWTCVEGFFLLLVPLFLAHTVDRPLSKADGGGDGDYISYKKMASLRVCFCPGWSEWSEWRYYNPDMTGVAVGY